MAKFKRIEADYKKFILKHQEEWLRIGQKVASMRKKLRVSQVDLAKRAGICAATLRKLETGRYITRFKPISTSCLNALKALGYEGLLATQT